MFTDVLVETGIAYDSIPAEVRNTIKPANTPEKCKEREEDINKNPRLDYERKLCHYYRKQKPEKIGYMYRNVVDAMSDITKHDIAIALGEEKYDGELKEIYESKKISPIKRKIGEMGKTSETMTDKDRETLFIKLMQEREKDVERAVASKMAIEYVGGMTDNTILAALIEKNLISRRQLVVGYGRAEPGKEEPDSGVTKLHQAFAKTEGSLS